VADQAGLTDEPAGPTTGAPLPYAAICLVRHSESTWITEARFQGRADPPLSALGEHQARLVARRLRDRHLPPALPVPGSPPQAIWHSPLSRGAATAARIADDLAMTAALRADEALVELGQGEWEGLTHAYVQGRWPVELAAWRADPVAAQAPGGERLRDGSERVAAFVDRILHEMAGSAGTTAPWSIVVSHDGILRLMLMRLLDIPLERFWAFPFPVAGISVIDLVEGRPRLRAHALTDHLAAEADSADRGGAL